MKLINYHYTGTRVLEDFSMYWDVMTGATSRAAVKRKMQNILVTRRERKKSKENEANSNAKNKYSRISLAPSHSSLQLIQRGLH